MNKADIIDAIAKGAGLTKEKAKDALEAFLESITGALANGEKVTIIGFGTFSITELAARVGLNPQTQEKLHIPARKAVRFKSGKELREKTR